MDPKYDYIASDDVPHVGDVAMLREQWVLLRDQLPLLSLTVVLSIAVAFSDFLSLALIYPALNTIVGVPIKLPAALSFFSDILAAFEQEPVRTRFRMIAVALLVLILTRSILTYFSTLSMGALSRNIEEKQRSQFLTLVLSLELQFLNRYKGSQLFAMLSNFTVHAARVTRTLTSALAPALLLTVYGIAIFLISPKLTLLAAITVVISAAVVQLCASRIRTLATREMNSFLRLNQIGYEFITGIRLIKSFGREGTILTQYSEMVSDAVNLTFEKTLVQALMTAVTTNISALLLALVLLAATYLLDVDGPQWVAAVLMYLAVMGRLAGPLQQLNTAKSEISGDWPYMRLLFGFKEAAESHVREDAGEDVKRLEGDIAFEHVNFRYGDDLPMTLNDVSLTFEVGTTTALVGRSGAGKSTITGLLTGLYRPNSGAIRVGATPLEAYKTSSWQQMIGVVSQDVFLLNDTVLTNIRFGKADATYEECVEAAKQANAHDFILALEKGYDTVVGDRGLRLSGGQAQRLSLARVFVKNPPLLILDEATSALDSESEHLIQSAIERAARQRTVVVIAHRLATVRKADRICVMQDGKVAEQGTHAELANSGGLYQKLLEMQDLAA